MKNKPQIPTTKELIQAIDWVNAQNSSNSEWVYKHFRKLEESFWEWRGDFEDRLEKLERKQKRKKRT